MTINAVRAEPIVICPVTTVTRRCSGGSLFCPPVVSASLRAGGAPQLGPAEADRLGPSKHVRRPTVIASPAAISEAPLMGNVFALELVV